MWKTMGFRNRLHRCFIDNCGKYGNESRPVIMQQSKFMKRTTLYSCLFFNIIFTGFLEAVPQPNSSDSSLKFSVATAHVRINATLTLGELEFAIPSHSLPSVRAKDGIVAHTESEGA